MVELQTFEMTCGVGSPLRRAVFIKKFCKLPYRSLHIICAASTVRLLDLAFYLLCQFFNFSAVTEMETIIFFISLSHHHFAG
jgi:hypothetical protein